MRQYTDHFKINDTKYKANVFLVFGKLQYEQFVSIIIVQLYYQTPVPSLGEKGGWILGENSIMRTEFLGH